MLDHTIFNERPESQERALKELQAMGYQYIPRAEAEQKRGHLSRVLFPDVMREFLSSQSYTYRGKVCPFPDDAIGEAIRELDAPLERGLMYASKIIYDRLIYGKSCEIHLYDGNTQSYDISYIDWEHPEKNIWQVTEEFSVERLNGKYVRPDIVILVNGIPLAVIECKKSSVDVDEGVNQNVRNWQPDYIPQLFKFTQLVFAVNPDNVKYGTAGTTQEYYCKWHEENAEWQEESAKRYVDDGHITEQDKVVVSMLSHKRLLNIISHYILYDGGVKKVARYQQFFGVENTMSRILGKDSSTTPHGGVIWHTQGSGKSLTMVMLVKRILAEKSIISPRFVLVCDRINLIKQLRDNFIYTGMKPVEATTGKGLIALLNDKGNTIIATTINKFETAAKARECYSEDNIFLLIDESHRSHTGEFHIMMNNVLPKAFKVGFTGTPLLKKDKNNTYSKFGKQIGSAYRFEEGIRDGVIVPLVYDGRVIPQTLSGKEAIDKFRDSILAPLTEEQKEDMNIKWSRFVKIAQTDQRIAMIAFDIHEHFLQYCKPRGFKALVTVSSRATAVRMEHAINNIGGVKAAALICRNSGAGDADGGENSSLTASDSAIINNFFKTEVEPRFGQNYEDYEEYLKNNMRGGDDVDIVVVQSMWLTGFDAPPLAVLYVDKSLKEHTLLQAIARVNRIYPGKDFGLIVDYWGLFSKLSTALEMYSDDKTGLSGFSTEDLEGSIQTANEEKDRLEKSHKDLLDLFGDVNFDKSNSRSWIEFFDCEDDNKKLRKEFYEKLSSFSKMMTLAVSSYNLYQIVGLDTMQQYKADLLFFQKLRAELMSIYQEKVDFSKYEDSIKNLLNTFVTSEPVEMVVEPVALHDKLGMEKQLEQIDGKKARAAYIQTRIVSELEARRYDDPLTYKRFSERIRNTIAEYRKSRDENSYLNSMQQMAEDLREGFTGNSYPSNIDKDSDAKAFYGVLVDVLKPVSGSVEVFDEDLGVLALNIKDAIQSLARVDWRISVAINKKMKQSIEDYIWDFSDAHNIDLDLDSLDRLIESIMKTAISRY